MPVLPPPKRSVDQRQLTQHEERIATLELAIRQNTGQTTALIGKVDGLSTIVSEMVATVNRVTPTVDKLAKDSMALCAVKKVGTGGGLVTIGVLLESYGPELARFVARWLAG